MALCAETIAASVQPQYENHEAILNADFDGDSRPDVAVGTSHGLGYTIEIQFSAQMEKTYLTLANGGFGTRIFAWDVDKDSYPDLVVTSASSLLPIAVYLSDGKGHFQHGNPWSFLPFGLDTPYSFRSGSFPLTFVGLVPQTRLSLGAAKVNAMTATLEVEALISELFEKALAQPHADSRKSRSPPLSLPL